MFWRTRPRLYSEEARSLVGSLVGKAGVCRDSEGSVASGRLDKEDVQLLQVRKGR